MEALGKVFKGGFWLFLANVVTAVSGFIYWVVISIVGGVEVLGYTSTVIGLSSLFTTFSGLGITAGVQRFVGEKSKSGEVFEVSKYFWSSFTVFLASFSLVSFVLFILSLVNSSIFGFNSLVWELTALLTFVGVFSIFRGLFMAVLKTEAITLSAFLGNIGRILIGYFLVVLGFGWVGASLGYIFPSLLLGVVGFLYVARMGLRPTFSFNAALDVVKAGLVSWFPNLISAVGLWSGVLAVFASTGAVETGAYYIALTLSAFVVGFSSNSLILLLPVLSGMTDGRKRACWKAMKLGLALAVPLAFVLITYPGNVLGLLGEKYIGASQVLVILSVSSILTLFITPVTNLVYAYGFYLMVLALGLVTNVSRVVSYLVLTPVWGSVGTALSHLIGSVFGVLAAGFVAYRVGLRVRYDKLTLIVLIPLLLSFPFRFLGVFWVLGGGLIVLLSYFLYGRFGLVSRGEVVELVKAFLPKNIVSRVKPLGVFLLDLVYG